MFSKKIIIRVLINTAVGVILVFLWLKFTNIEEVWKVLQRVNLSFVFLYVGLFSVAGFLRALRLKVLLKTKSLGVKKLLPLNFLSQFLSFMIPLRIGELTKGIYISTNLGVPFSKTLVWIFLDRFLDFWVNLLIVSVLLLLIETRISVNFEQIIILLFLAFSLLPLVAIKSTKIAKKLAESFSKVLVFKKIKSAFLGFSFHIIEGFEILNRGIKELSILGILTFLAIFCEGLMWLIVFRSLGVDLGVLTALLGSLLTALTFLIPSAPGYVGSAEASGLLVFNGVLGIDASYASATTLLIHILNTLILLVFGLVSLYLLKFNLGLVWKKFKKDD